MANPQHADKPEAKINEEAIAQIAGVAGIDIPPERLPGAAERLSEMLSFLDQLEGIDTSRVAPAAIFDPAWDESQRP